jgi:hypothetical protein
VGVVEVVKESYPDETAWDPADPHFDPKTDKDKPRWFKVDVKFVRRTTRLIGLREIKAEKQLAEMTLVKSGRLSVQPVAAEHWAHICDVMEPRPAPPAAAATKKGAKKAGKADGHHAEPGVGSKRKAAAAGSKDGGRARKQPARRAAQAKKAV